MFVALFCDVGEQTGLGNPPPFWRIAYVRGAKGKTLF